jgi:hypothetical protein
MKQYLEIELKNTVDPFDVQQYLSNNKTLKVYVVDNCSLRIWFNENKITSKNVVKLVLQAANERTRKAA